MKLLALFFTLILLSTSGLAASVTVDIYGTNVSNAQSNLTQTGNNSYQVVQWATGDTTKSLKAEINGNASDDITFTIHNLTVSRVIEVKVNSSSYNSYQADGTGTISFTRTQTVRNQTYSFTPAVNSGGYNSTWAWIWNRLQNITLPLSALNRSDQNVFSANESNASVVKQANGSYSIDTTRGVTGGSGWSPTTQTTNRSYVLNTVYQNLNSTAMFMTVSTQGAAGVIRCTFKVDTVNPPTAVVGAEGGIGMNSFWVLPNYYFSVSESDTCIITRWTVWQ